MTPLSPDDFRTRLDGELTGPPPLREPGAALADGRRLVRRRRLAVAAAGVAVLVAAGGVTGSLTAARNDAGPGFATDPSSAAPSGPPSTDAELVQACRDGNQSGTATAAMFGSGQPTVTAVTRTRRQVLLTLQAADDRHWAGCFVNLGAQEFAAGMTVWATRDPGSGLGVSYSSGGGCALVDGEVDPTCPSWFLAVVDRLPTEVDAVRFDIAGGVSEVVDSVDGYVVLNYLGPLPEGASTTDLMSFQPLVRITYLDADGVPIAAQAMDGSGSGPDGQRVDGLPRLSAFPSLRGDSEL